MIARRWVVSVAAICAGAWGVLALWEVSQARATSPANTKAGQSTEAAPQAVLGFTGTSGCSARGCHGGSEAVKGQTVQQIEYSLVLAHDKHPHAYQVLLGERSKAMAKNLGIESAHKDSRCLACHTVPQFAAQIAPSAEELAIRESGVGCEACHGPAGTSNKPWLHSHTGAAWKKLSDEQKQDHGMRPMTDLKVQAQVCAGCHVGAAAENGVPARDCNHDIMAAGHPRLNFELSAFRANLPPHWNVEAREKLGSAHEAKVWAVGQVASAKAAVDLLADRADRAAKAPWPEFAEYGCFSCHANLQLSAERLSALKSGKRRLGSLVYNTWYSAALPAVAVHTPTPEGDVRSSFAGIRLGLSNGTPAAKITGEARATSKQLEAWLTQVNGATFSQDSVRKMLPALAAKDAMPRQLDWDEVEQIALAAAVLGKASDSKGLQEPVEKLFGALAFPAGCDSPRDYPHQKGLDEAFKQVVEQLHK